MKLYKYLLEDEQQTVFKPFDKEDIPSILKRMGATTVEQALNKALALGPDGIPLSKKIMNYSNVDINDVDEFYKQGLKPAFVQAMHEWNYDMAYYMIEQGLRVNKRFKVGNIDWDTYLNYCISSSAPMVIIKLLLEHGADPTIKDEENGNNALITFCRSGVRGDTNRLVTIDLLMNNGVNINDTDKHGHTALIWAVTQMHPDKVEKLLEYNPDISIKDHNGHDALWYAPNYPSIERILNRYKENIKLK